MYASGPRVAKSVAELQPGDVLHYDFRPAPTTRLSKSAAPSAQTDSALLPQPFRVVQWNIERGARLGRIVRDLEACEADILVLQELDIGCRRSGYVNVPEQLARALKAELYFVCEFVEFDAASRSVRNCVGSLSPQGPENEAEGAPSSETQTQTQHLHGNAILSRGATMHYPYVIIHNTGIDWGALGQAICEPRRGTRLTLRVTLQPAAQPLTKRSATTRKAKKDASAASSSSSSSSSFAEIASSSLVSSDHTVGAVHVYCSHFEIFCGSLTRLRQLADCMQDAHSLLDSWQVEQAKVAAITTANNSAALEEGTQQAPHADPASHFIPRPSFILAGDLNTIAHGIVRLSRLFASDRLRLLSIGETEACWVQRKVLSRNMDGVGCERNAADERKEGAEEDEKEEGGGDDENSVHTTHGTLLSPLKYVRKAVQSVCDAMCTCYSWCTGSDTVWRWLYGLSKSELAALDNRALGFYDPTDKFRCITLDFAGYRGYVRGKLDWILLSNLRLVPQPLHVNAAEHRAEGTTEGGNNEGEGGAAEANATQTESKSKAKDGLPDGVCLFDEKYEISDHKGVVMLVTQEGTSRSTRDGVYYPHERNLYTDSLYAKGWLVCTRLCLWLLVLWPLRPWLTWRWVMCGVCFGAGFVLHALARQRHCTISLQL